MFKVIVAQPIKEAGVKMLEQQGYLVECLSNHDVESLCKAVENADGLLVEMHVLVRSGIRVIFKSCCSSWRGLDGLILLRNGIWHSGHKRTLANSVAVTEHVMAMMLCHAKNLFHVDYENGKETLIFGQTIWF